MREKKSLVYYWLLLRLSFNIILFAITIVLAYMGYIGAKFIKQIRILIIILAITALITSIQIYQIVKRKFTVTNLPLTTINNYHILEEYQIRLDKNNHKITQVSTNKNYLQQMNKQYLELYQKQPRNFLLLINLAIINQQLNNYAEAKQFAKQALEINPSSTIFIRR